MIDTNAKIWLPPGLSSGTTIAPTSFSLNASTVKYAMMLQAPKSGTLDKFEFSVVGTPSVNSGSQIRCSFQDPSTTNQGPDETQDQFRDIAGSAFSLNAWMVPGLMTSDGTDTGAKRTVTAGDYLCCVIEFQTFNSGDTIPIGNFATTSAVEGPFSWPIDTRKSGGTWASQTRRMVMALKYSDGSYERIAPITPPGSAFGSRSLASSGVDQGGLLFTLPIAVEVDAVFARLTLVNHSSDFQMIVYDQGNHALATVNCDASYISSVVGGVFFVLPSRLTLSANTTYRLAVKATTVNAVAIVYADFAAEAIKTAMGGAWQWTERTGSGPWTNTNTRLPMSMGIQIAAIGDAPSVIFPRRAVSVAT